MVAVKPKATFKISFVQQFGSFAAFINGKIRFVRSLKALFGFSETFWTAARSTCGPLS